MVSCVFVRNQRFGYNFFRPEKQKQTMLIQRLEILMRMIEHHGAKTEELFRGTSKKLGLSPSTFEKGNQAEILEILFKPVMLAYQLTLTRA